MGLKAGIFWDHGLGDGVNGLCLSHNLHLNGWQVDTYQNAMGAIREWSPHLRILPSPNIEELPKILSSYDYFFVMHNRTDPFILQLIQEGKRRFPDRIKVLYLYPSQRVYRAPYYSDCLVDPNLSIAENLRLFCKRILHLPVISLGNGVIPPSDLVHRKFPKRVVIHPTSSSINKDWQLAKFVKLALHLQKEGYEIVFIAVSDEQQEKWKNEVGQTFKIASFKTLDLFARFLYESGYLIGNDSGPGHLASSLGIPTLTFCRSRAAAKMWAPSFTKKIVVTPYTWIPNVHGFRFRDRYWKQLISVRRVQRAFERLIEKSRDRCFLRQSIRSA